MVQFDSADMAETAIGKFASFFVESCANFCLSAKFTGYQYGGRPLGITFVKYMNAGHGDMMDGAEPMGVTQDQIM